MENKDLKEEIESITPENPETSEEDYGENSIESLNPRDSVRKRPWMYVWSTSKRGVHHLVWEAINNSVDEAMAWYGDTIKIVLNKDGSITIEDSWRWIPYKPNEKTWISTLETVFTVLHAWGKFNAKAYKTSGWLHWIGLKILNYLGEFLEVEVKRDGWIHRMRFEEGYVVKSTETIGTCPIEETWTKITFKPSAEIFSETEFDEWIIHNYLEVQSYLLKWLRFVVINDITETTKEFYSENWVLDYLDKVAGDRTTVCKPILINWELDFTTRKGEKKTLTLETAIQWFDWNTNLISSYVNGAHTVDGGTHLEWFKNWIKRALDKWIDFKKYDWSIMKNLKNRNKDDLYDWLEWILSAKFYEPEFEGQTKGILGSKEVVVPASQIVFDKFYEYLELNPLEADKIVKKIELNVKLRLASENAQKEVVKNKSEVMKKLINRFWDCESKKPEEKELFIVEGTSAAGSMKDARNPKHQAILWLRGVVLNTEGKTFWEISKNAEIQTLLAALDCGWGKNYDESKLKFHKIILSRDADSDGRHIEALLLTFLFRFLPDLFKNNHIYRGIAPLYKIEYKGKQIYFYTKEELEKFLEANKVTNPVTRFKWLGEMSVEHIEPALLSPVTRKIVRITYEDVEEMSKIVNDLMGKITAPKFHLLQNYHIDKELVSV